MPLYLHENRQETQARVPHYDFFFASLDNFRIHQRPWLLSRQSQKSHAPIRANLRRGDAPPIPRRFSPIRQRVSEILHQRPNLRCGRVFHLLCCLAQSRISQLQHGSNRHVLPPLRASAFGAFLNPVGASPFYLNSFFAFVDAVSSASNLLRFFPLPRFRRTEHRLNHRHIRYRIFQRHRNLAPLANRPRERVPLHGILVASGNYFRHYSAAQGVSPVINKNFARPVVRRIEGNLHLDPSLRPQKLHALVPHQLRAARKHRLSRRNLQYCRGQPVRTEFRIPLGDSRHSQWLFSENPSRRRNRVAPDIHQPTAAPLRHVAHIFRIAVEVAECSHDRSQLSDHAPANELTRSQPLRMRFHHECFAYLYATPVPRGQERLRFRNR